MHTSTIPFFFLLRRLSSICLSAFLSITIFLEDIYATTHSLTLSRIHSVYNTDDPFKPHFYLISSLTFLGFRLFLFLSVSLRVRFPTENKYFHKVYKSRGPLVSVFVVR